MAFARSGIGRDYVPIWELKGIDEMNDANTVYVNRATRRRQRFDWTAPLVMEIRALLFQEWDPIGINQNLHMADEYDSYVPIMHWLVKRGRSAAAMAVCLNLIEKNYMAYVEDEDVNRAVCARIFELAEAARQR